MCMEIKVTHPSEDILKDEMIKDKNSYNECLISQVQR